MKIAQLAAGAGGMVCGACLHENTLAAALLAAGQDVLLIPAYTPLRTDEENVSSPRVFFGGINVTLQQRSALFRHTPWWLDRLLDHPWLLRRATNRAAATNPAQLGDLTISMLEGESGRQEKELDKLVEWLRRDVRPDVVHLSNALLLGMAPAIHRRLGVPVVCSLAGEDAFLEKLPPPFYQQARSLLAERARSAAAFTALNHYYADFAVEYLGIERERITVIPHGLNLEGHGTRIGRPLSEPVAIGFLARICHDKGLHLLVDAFTQLARDASLPEMRLRVAGYLGAADRDYLSELERQLREAGLADRYDYVGELDRPGKIAFLQSLDVMALPTVYRESKGISALEAMANAVPVVVPDHGAFPELIEDTGGGLLFEAHNPQDLARQLAHLIREPQQATELGQRGQAAIADRYHARLMAKRTIDLYRRLIASA